MIAHPEVGMQVVVTGEGCCDGHTKGTRGVIVDIIAKDSFFVRNQRGKEWLQCRRCVAETGGKG